MALPILYTKRLILRPWREGDLTPFAKLNANPRVMEFYPKILSKSESDALVTTFQKEIALQGYGYWAVEAPGVAEFIGFIGLKYWNLEMSFAPCIDVGWRLGFCHWGKGYATEGAQRVIQYGFEILKLSEIVSMATIRNIRSQRVMKRLGMSSDPNENFEHPRVPRGDPLSWRVLYRLSFERWARFMEKSGRAVESERSFLR